MKAKMRGKIFILLSTIICGIFAFTLGVTFASYSFTMSVESNPKSFNAYAAKQAYAVVNDATNIPFGLGAHNCTVGVDFAYGYDIDVMLKYSMKWSNDMSTDNVILNFADRDNLVVDGQYIYMTKPVTACYDETGKAITKNVNFIVGVDYADPMDVNYYNASLTITVEEVKVYKANKVAYNESHPLYVADSEAAKTWLKAKNSTSIDGAYVMLYNYRSTIANGLQHYGDVTAYKKDVTESAITSSTWLGGNTSYAGVNMYVVAGNTDVELRAKVLATWRNKQTGAVLTSSSSDASLVFDNNIKINYSDNWTSESAEAQDDVEKANADYDTFYYKYVIPAGTTAFINIADSIEITKRNALDGTDFSNYKIVVSGVDINDTSFTTFANNLATGIVANATTSATESYTQPTFTVINTSKYSAGLFNSSATAAQTFDSHVTIINNTASPLTVDSKNLEVKIIRSNGISTQYLGRAGETYAFGGNCWYREELTQSGDTYITASSLDTLTIAPFSSSILIDRYTVGASLKDIIGNYDVFVELDVAVACSESADSSRLELISSKTVNGSKANITYSLKNNSDKLYTGASITINPLVYTPTFTGINTFPSDEEWACTYFNYFIKDGTTYTRNTELTHGATATGVYYSLSYTWNAVSLDSIKTYNGFTGSSKTYSNSGIVIKPNETVAVMSFETDANNSYTIDGSNVKMFKMVSYNDTVTGAASENNTINIINEGSADAYISNNTDDFYAVRFKGTVDTTKTTNVFYDSADKYNYYLGAVKPGQIIPIVMSSAEGFTFEGIKVGDATSNLYDVDLSNKESIKQFFTAGAIPTDYQQVEYLESNGTQLINTEYSNINDSTNKYEAKFSVSSWSKSGGVFGASGTEYHRIGMFWLNPELQMSISIGNILSNNSSYHLDYTYNQIIDKNIVVDNVNKKYQIDGTTYTFTGSSNDSGKITLFGVNDEPSNIRVYNFKIYANNVLVRNLVPCVRKSDNVAGMFDMVNNKFYTNSGTGTFLKGANVADTDTSTPIVNAGERTLNLYDNRQDYIAMAGVLSGDRTATGWTLINNITVTDSTGFCAFVFKIVPVDEYANETIYLSVKAKIHDAPKARICLGYGDADGNNRIIKAVKDFTSDGVQSVSMKVDKNTYSGKYVFVWLYSMAGNGTNGSSVEFSDIMVSVGDHPYEPYGYDVPIKSIEDNIH